MSHTVLIAGTFRSFRVAGYRKAVVEALERRTLLAAQITVLDPTGQQIVDGQNIDLTSLVGPVDQADGQTFTTMFTVRNDGDETLQLGVPTQTGDFTIQRAPLALLGPGDSSPLELGLDLTTAGTRTGMITLPTNDPNVGFFDFTVDLDVSQTGPQIDITNGLTDLVNGVSTVDFGTAALGQTRPTQTFTINNLGTEPLNLRPATLPFGFAITQNFTPTIQPGESSAFTVAMDTSQLGTRSGTISIPSDDPNQNPFNIPVTGRVVAPTPSVTVQVDSQPIQNGVTTVDFGTIGQGLTAPTKTFTVTNSGSSLLTLGQVSVPAGFTVTEPLNSSLTPGASDAFTVRLDNTTLGTRSGMIQFATNDPAQSPFAIPVIGTVVAAEPNVTVASGGVNLVSGVTPVDFGSVGQGLAGPVRTFTVSNSGTTPLTLGSVTVPAGFTLTQALNGASLDPGASDSFVVQMDTSTLGPRSGSISFTTNDPNQNPFTIPVTGTVLQAVPAAVVSEGGQVLQNGVSRVDFGSVGQGQTAPVRTFTVSNQGTSALTLGTPTLPAGFVLTEPLATSLNPGESDTFDVQLDSSTLGTRSGTIQFATGDPRQNPFVIPVIGTVVTAAPQLAVQEGGQTLVSGVTAVDFGSIGQGQIGPARTFTVTNTGTADATLGAVSVPAGFILSEPLEPTLVPGGTDTFTVQLDSATVGTRSGTISFATNVAGANPFAIPVTGTVTAPATAGAGTVGTGTGNPGIIIQLGTRRLRSGASAVNFRSATRGAAGPMRTFTLTNRGTGTVALSRVRLPKGFTLIDPPASTLAAGETGTFTVQLDTTRLGRRAGTIRLLMEGKRSFAIPVTGRVTRAAASATPQLFSKQGIIDV